MAFELPPLPYGHPALEPVIDGQTMHLHHDKHHAGYVSNLNAALEKHPELGRRSVEELLRNLHNVPEDIRTAVRNHGGGHANHSMFWKIMMPKGGGTATGLVAEGIQKEFGGFEPFVQKFNEAGAKHFGSGWVWLARDGAGKLHILTTPNQDSPLTQGFYPILGNDLWEHAYYLQYQNRRADYLKAWWETLNWKEVNRRYEESVELLKKLAA
ncbi:MAG TPA: superoxide dismutase [Terriglobales bacterium]|nr:superoxide dismutase [Terriglobales bacterium]